MQMIDDGEIDLVINIPREYDQLGRPDGYLIRRRAVEAEVPLITDLQLARALIEALRLARHERPQRARLAGLHGAQRGRAITGPKRQSVW